MTINAELVENSKITLKCSRRGHFNYLFTGLNKGFNQHLVNRLLRCRLKPFLFDVKFLLKQRKKNTYRDT